MNHVNLFQEDPSCKIFLGSISACGTGITLTASSYVCFVEFSWVSGENEQAEKRVRRIGQKSTCHYDYLVFDGSLDHQILKAQTAKAEQIKKTMVVEDQEKGEKEMTEKEVTKIIEETVRQTVAPISELLRVLAGKLDGAVEKGVAAAHAAEICAEPASPNEEPVRQPAVEKPKGRGRPKKEEAKKEEASEYSDLDFMNEVRHTSKPKPVTIDEVRKRIEQAIGSDKTLTSIIRERLANYGVTKLSQLDGDSLYKFNSELEELCGSESKADDDFM